MSKAFESIMRGLIEMKESLVMNDKNKLIAEQALLIRKISLINEEYKTNLNKIHTILYCVGGPLNDRYHHYNKHVEDVFIDDGYYLAKPLNEIDKLTYTYDSIDDYIEIENRENNFDE